MLIGHNLNGFGEYRKILETLGFFNSTSGFYSPLRVLFSGEEKRIDSLEISKTVIS